MLFLLFTAATLQGWPVRESSRAIPLADCMR
jgi:hypothetical protein